MKSARIAARYAKALFELARENNLLSAVNNDMVVLTNICDTNKDFAHLLESPIISQAKKTEVFKSIFFTEFNQISYNFLAIIIKKRRESMVKEIAIEFINLYKDHLNIKTVLLKTATEPNDAIVVQLKKILKEQLKAEIDLVKIVNSNLIGGFIINYEDRQYDSSIRRNINRLMKEYNINIYEPKF